MSKRTFISKWNPYPKPPPIPAKSRGRSRHEDLHPEKRKEGNSDGGIRWYGDPSQTRVPPRITSGRMTQRVGLFRNAKQSQIVVNEISSVVRKASNKQIGRLVAPDKDVSCSTSSSVDELFPRQHVTTHEAECNPLDTDMRYNGLSKRKEREEFPYRLRYDEDYGSEGNSMLTAERNPADSRAEIPRFNNDPFLRRSPKTSKWRARVEAGDSGLEDLSYEDARPSSIREMYIDSIPKIATLRKGSMQTPSRGCSRNEAASLGDPANGPSMSDVAARVLSALPPIYLRDDHHEKYDTLAVRLLADSIKNSDSMHGSTSEIFRSFLNRTAGMIAEENPTQPEDDGCEDIFQERALNLGASPSGPSGTPVLEKLFNQTVAEWNADNSLGSPLRTGVNATRASSMMTPSSISSIQLDAQPFPFEDGQLWEPSSPVADLDNFPFSRETSPRSPCSSDESDDVDQAPFEWTIPPAKSDIFDVMNGE